MSRISTYIEPLLAWPSHTLDKERDGSYGLQHRKMKLLFSHGKVRHLTFKRLAPSLEPRSDLAEILAGIVIHPAAVPMRLRLVEHLN